MVSTAPSAQVKVVKKEVTPASEAPQVSRPLTSTGAYQNEDIIITDINNSNKIIDIRIVLYQFFLCYN